MSHRMNEPSYIDTFHQHGNLSLVQFMYTPIVCCSWYLCSACTLCIPVRFFNAIKKFMNENEFVRQSQTVTLGDSSACLEMVKTDCPTVPILSGQYRFEGFSPESRLNLSRDNECPAIG